MTLAAGSRQQAAGSRQQAAGSRQQALKFYGCKLLLLIVIVSLNNTVVCQPISDTIPNFRISPQKLDKLEKKFNATHSKLLSIQHAALQNLEKQQQEITKAIGKLDSGFALHLQQQWEDHIAQLSQSKGPYIPRLDTLTSLLKYIGQNQGDLPKVAKLEDLIGDMSGKLAECNVLQNAAVQQRQLITQWMGNIGNLDAGLLKKIKDYNLQLVGYKQQIEEWKATLNEPAKLERAVLDGLQKIPAFSRFLEQNSQLAAILGGTGGGGSGQEGVGIPIPGMQSRQTLLQQLQQRFGSNAQSSGTVPQVMQQSVDEAIQRLGSLDLGMEKLEGLFEGGGAIGNQNITPQEKEKAAFKAVPGRKKLNFGYNIQSGGGVNYFPAINDIGLKAGYQLNPRFEAGIGLAYKLGLGESWQKIKLSHEGLALRTFVDWRITPAGDSFLKGFWLTAGYERNYWDNAEVPISPTPNSTTTINSLSQWTHSGVAGVTKKIAKGKKELQFQLLWQFAVSNSPEPITPILFRWGKSF